MNYEQFVYWLSGYLSAINPSASLTARQLKPILDTLKNVKKDQAISQGIAWVPAMNITDNDS